jgi:hypothetical protein
MAVITVFRDVEENKNGDVVQDLANIRIKFDLYAERSRIRTLVKIADCFLENLSHSLIT